MSVPAESPAAEFFHTRGQLVDYAEYSPGHGAHNLAATAAPSVHKKALAASNPQSTQRTHTPPAYPHTHTTHTNTMAKCTAFALLALIALAFVAQAHAQKCKHPCWTASAVASHLCQARAAH
jgi:hypothetical protein